MVVTMAEAIVVVVVRQHITNLWLARNSEPNHKTPASPENGAGVFLFGERLTLYKAKNTLHTERILL